MSRRRFGVKLRLTSQRGDLVMWIYQAYHTAPWTHADLLANGLRINPATIGQLRTDKLVECQDRAEKPRRWRLTDRVVEGIEAGRCYV
jgi:hypothetical protein